MKKLFTIILIFITANLFSQIPQITVLQSNNPASGKIFMSNLSFGGGLFTPHLLIIDNDGSIYFSRQMEFRSYDFKKQKNGLYTYMSENEQLSPHRYSYGLDNNYNIVDSFRVVSPQNDTFYTDFHECQVLANGHALMLGVDERHIDMSQIVPGGNPNAKVAGIVIQEIDENNNLIFNWNSFDYFLITDAIGVNLTGAVVDPWHTNAIELDTDGNILISSRHLCEITKINRQTGAIIWRLGGPQNQFTFVNDAGFSYQHDIRRLPNGNITLFDNGNFNLPQESRAVEYQLDEINLICTRVWEYRHIPAIFGFAMGSAQRLPNGNTLISWGTNNIITEVTTQGTIALEMRFPQNVFSYRTYKHELTSTPMTLNLNALIEGFYNPVSNSMVSDTITVYLRNAGFPYSILDSARGALNSSGNGSFTFNNMQNLFDCMIVVKHRNSIETCSQEVVFINNSLTYDFTTSQSQAYGNNLILRGNKYCIYSGDANQDGIIDASDLSIVDNDVFNSITGYVSSDLNGDYIVDASDFSIIDNNIFNVISIILPY